MGGGSGTNRERKRERGRKEEQEDGHNSEPNDAYRLTTINEANEDSQQRATYPGTYCKSGYGRGGPADAA